LSEFGVADILKITAMPAFTSEGFAGKCRVVRRAEFDDDDGIIAAILKNDAERVGIDKRTTSTTATRTARDRRLVVS
jgi:hypothetical protein